MTNGPLADGDGDLSGSQTHESGRKLVTLQKAKVYPRVLLRKLARTLMARTLKKGVRNTWILRKSIKSKKNEAWQGPSNSILVTLALYNS